MKADLSRFARTYFVEPSPEMDHDPGDHSWLWVIQCRGGGHLYTFSADALGYFSPLGKATPGIKRKLRDLPFVTFEQEGDAEYAVHFGVGHLDEVALVVGARRRRRASSRRKAQLATAGAQTRFKTRHTEPVSSPRSGANKATHVEVAPDGASAFCSATTAPSAKNRGTP